MLQSVRPIIYDEQPDKLDRLRRAIATLEAVMPPTAGEAQEAEAKEAEPAKTE